MPGTKLNNLLNIQACIENKAKFIEEIAIALNIDQIKLIEEISTMEIQGSIKDVAGGRYIGLRL